MDSRTKIINQENLQEITIDYENTVIFETNEFTIRFIDKFQRGNFKKGY